MYVGVSLILLPVQAVDIIGVENVQSQESTSARIVFAATMKRGTRAAVANVQSPILMNKSYTLLCLFGR